MKKKLSKIIIAILIATFIFPVLSFAQTEYVLPEKSEAFENWENLEEKEKEKAIQPLFYSTSAMAGIQRSKYNMLLGNTALESTYNLASLFNTVVKDQKRTGSCWAFSATSMMESSAAVQAGLLKQEYSPYHMEYYTYDMYNRGLGAGGNIFMAVAYMTNGYGPALEKDLPMASVYDYPNNSSSTYYLTDRANVDLDKTAQLRPTHTTEFPTIAKKYNSSTKVVTYSDGAGTTYTDAEVKAIRDKIKTHIKTYGAVSATMYIDIAINAGGEFVSNYYDSANNIFRCTSNSKTSNHQVTIVGWDDTKEAWIVLNSYGTAFGNGGYFYISYDDNYIEANVYGVNGVESIANGKNYDNLYQYDELGMNYGIGTGSSEIYFSNVFERETAPEDKNEYINEVGLYVMETSGIEVYVNSADGDFVDAEGNSKLKLVSSGHILEPGYHVIKLNPTDDTKLTGDNFVLAIKVINQTGATVPLEANYYHSKITTYSTGYDKAKSSAEQSYISTDGLTWTDVAGLKVGTSVTLRNTNTCVRAFTKYVAKQTNIPVTDVELDKTEVTLTEGETENLTATVLPTDATNKNITWESTNESVATIENGVITAIQAGTTNIKVITEDGGYTANCQVTVQKPVVPVTGIVLTPIEKEIEVDETCTLTATVLPEDATNKNITWETSNPAVATVSNGVVTGLKEGTATITVRTEDMNLSKSATIKVKAKTINVLGVTLDKQSNTIKEDQTFTLTATVFPENATNKNITWQSSNASVATVSNGVVTGVAAGTATITVKTTDGNYTASCEVTVEKKTINVTGVTLDKITHKLTEGETFTLTATVLPENATNKNITWSSSNSTVAKVENGVVTALKEGTAIITVKTVDGNHTATCAVTVEKKVINVTGVTLDKASAKIKVGSTVTLIPTITPADATNKNITWQSSNASVATVSNGVVTGVAAGTATITVKTTDGNHKATCNITVEAEKPPVINVTGVSLNKTNETLKIGETLTLVQTVTPANATNQKVTWQSSNASVAKIENGVVTALSEGTATITVKTEDGNHTATCQVTVEKNVINVTGVSLNKTNEALKIGGTLSLVQTITPANATNQNVTWETSNSNVAKVENGVVTALSEGIAIITVKTEDGNHTATCEVVVEKEKIKVTGVSLNKTNESLKIGKTLALTPTITPENATNKNITWSTSNENVATISNGVVTAVSEGKTTITVKTEDGNHTATCEIVVEKDIIKVTGVTLEQESVTVRKGTTISLLGKVKVLPENATNKNVIFESSNTEVATISEGIVTTLKAGTATITVKTEDGEFTDTFTITVEEQINAEVKVESIKIDKQELELEVADRATLVITFNPELPSNTKIKWESSNPKVATVDENGIVTAVGTGKVTITATSEDGGHTAKCTITVKKQVEDPDDIYKVEDPTINKNPIPNAGATSVIALISVVLIAMVYSFIRIRLMKDVK